jgi:tetratricopeptide (TPR) repeat protein
MRRINLHSSRVGSVLAVFAALLAVTTAATATLAARSDSAPQPAAQPDSALAAALIQQAWPTVAELLDSDPSSTPAMQFIQAHAFTALNQPNESLCTLLSVSTDENIAAWRDWTQTFQARYPQQAVSYYLLGDARARSGDTAGAIATFTTGLQLEPANSLLLNARGTAYAIQGDRQAARQDLVRAASDDRSLVAAKVGAGTLVIDRKGGSTDARSWFDSALGDPQPANALALYGRALTWVADGNWESANSDLQAALASAPCIAPLMATQLAALQDYMEGGALAAQDAESGFALATVIEPFLNAPTQQNAAALYTYLAMNPNDVSTAIAILRAQAAGHPMWASTASQQLNQVNAWSTSLQPTYATLSAVPTTMYPYTTVSAPTWLNGATSPAVYAASLRNPYAFQSVGTLQTTSTPLANMQVASALRDAVGTGITPGGFDASLHEARFDRGDWPAVTYYGLLYPGTMDRATP